ncbi:flagellar hook-basal body protein [Thalassobacillus sp. CUG 92003]|uniref:flagellar hook-basal body protein n=1 Tax=Thalassobacillus sp. CUG 92003 TaxID=2736641 RepID=UPI0015E702CD|nr:flagellar hook-basal body protein [Thalassobacillus sp. CUG 92003]
MSRVMIQSAVTMGQLQQKLNSIGNNLSNVNTPGYKSRQTDFSSLLFQQIDHMSDETEQVGRQTPEGIRIGSGARLAHTNIDLSQGSFQQTDRELDIALPEDNHMFQVQMPTENGTETRYTRAGNFYLNTVNDNELMITNGDGYPILGEDGPIILDGNMDDLSISENGDIVVTRNGERNVEGRLETVEAVRPRMLESAGNNTFRLQDPEALGFDPDEIIADIPVDEQVFQSGTLEQSNVDQAKQMTDMLNVQRSYQFNARSISTSDQMMGLVNQLRS